jgi:hypothetical protein
VQPGCTERRNCRRTGLRRRWSATSPVKRPKPWEIIYFKLYKSQLPVVEHALETTALMLRSDKSRGYGLEMICADFLDRSATQENQSEVLVLSLERLYKTRPEERRDQLCKGGPVERLRQKRPRLALDPDEYGMFKKTRLRSRRLEVPTLRNFAESSGASCCSSQAPRGSDELDNLMSLAHAVTGNSIRRRSS